MDAPPTNSKGQDVTKPFPWSNYPKGSNFALLDMTMIDSKPVLLDGKGNPLPDGAEPVYLPFRI